MKKFMFLGFLAAAFAMTSCDKIEEAVNDLQKDEAPTYVESKDGMTITVSYAKSGISAKTEAKFKQEGESVICTSCTCTTTYLTESFAKTAYEELKRSISDKDEIKVDGKTVTISYGEYVGMEKELVEFFLKTVYEGYKLLYE